MRLHDRPHFVYWHLDADGNCLYVGVSWNVKLRNINHRTSSSWWPLVDYTLSSVSMTREDAMLFEIEEIERLTPPHNVLYKRSSVTRKPAEKVA